LLDGYPPRDAEENFAHAARQAYIAFSMAVAAAAFEEVDCTPMEGFDPNAVDEILELREKGLRSQNKIGWLLCQRCVSPKVILSL